SPSGVTPNLDDTTDCAGDGAADEQEVLLGVHLDDPQAALGDALGAHLSGHARALVDVRRRGRRADRARRADVVRPVRHGPAREAVPLDGAGKALAAGDAAHLHAVALLERLDGDRVAGVPALGVAELDQRAVGADAGGLQMARPRPG